MTNRKHIIDAICEGRRIIFIDETLVNWRTKPKLAFAPIKDPIQIDNSRFTESKCNIVAAVSADNGLEGIVLTEDYVNQNVFLKIFKEISKNGKKYAVSIDNASYHKTNRVQNYFNKNDIKVIYNLTATPILNPIETIFMPFKYRIRILIFRQIT